MRSSALKLLRTVREQVSVSADFYIGMAIALLLLPLPWLCAWLLASAVHELCHYLALRCCGCRVSAIHISLKGTFMETDRLSLGNEAFCAYAGPVGAAVLLLFAKQLPRTAVCVLMQSAYNLIPVFPLDGGRGLGCLLKRQFGEETGKRIFSIIEAFTLLLIFLLAAYSVIKLGLGLLPAAIAVIFVVRHKRINIPCKKKRLGLQ